MLIIYSVPISCKPVYLRFLSDTPFGFLSLPCPLVYLPILFLFFFTFVHLPDYDSCLIPSITLIFGLDLDSVFEYSFACHFCTSNLCLPGYKICLFSAFALVSSGPLLRRNILSIYETRWRRLILKQSSVFSQVSVRHRTSRQ